MQPRSDLLSSSHHSNQLQTDSGLLAAATSLFSFQFFYSPTLTLKACSDMRRQHASLCLNTCFGDFLEQCSSVFVRRPPLIRFTEVNTFVVRTRLDFRCVLPRQEMLPAPHLPASPTRPNCRCTRTQPHCFAIAALFFENFQTLSCILKCAALASASTSTGIGLKRVYVLFTVTSNQ